MVLRRLTIGYKSGSKTQSITTRLFSPRDIESHKGRTALFNDLKRHRALPENSESWYMVHSVCWRATISRMAMPFGVELHILRRLVRHAKTARSLFLGFQSLMRAYDEENHPYAALLREPHLRLRSGHPRELVMAGDDVFSIRTREVLRDAAKANSATAIDLLEQHVRNLEKEHSGIQSLLMSALSSAFRWFKP